MHSIQYRIQSAGAAYNLALGFVPDRVEVTNYTKWATDATKVEFKWFRGMTAGYALSALCEDTSTNHAIESSNGFTYVPGAVIASTKTTITGVTQANPAVVTAASHGMGAAGTEVTVRIRDIVGMTQLNDNTYRAVVVNANSFSLKDMNGVALDSTAYTAYSSAGNVYNLTAKTVDTGGYLTLGSTIMGADNDILYVVAYLDENRIDLGDVT